MRIGVSLARRDRMGCPLTGAELADRAAMIERVGIDGAWGGEHIPLPGDLARDMSDTLLQLGVVAAATQHIELGTAIYCLPLHNPFAAAQRFSTLQAFAPGRVTIGVGTGSQPAEYEAIGLEWEGRFRRLRQHMEAVRAVFDGGWNGRAELREGDLFEPGKWNASPVAAPELAARPTFAMTVGPPRFVLGAWGGEIQLARAARDYDGWMTSGGPGTAGRGWKRTLRDGIARYRDLGGTRAMVTSVPIDLRASETPLDDDGGFTLACPPHIAEERLQVLTELGYDDVILRPLDYHSNGKSRQTFDYDEDDLREYRSLLPKQEGPSD